MPSITVRLAQNSLAIAAAALLIGAAAALMGPILAPILLLGFGVGAIGVAAAIVPLSRSTWIVFVVILAASISRVGVSVSGLDVIPERVVLPLLVAGLAFVMLARQQPVRITAHIAYFGLGLLLAANILGSVINAPNPVAGLRGVAVIVVASIPMWLLPLILSDRKSLDAAIWTWFGLGVVEALLGFLALIVHIVNPAMLLGLQLDPLTGAFAPYGTLWEGNIFGSFEGAVVVSSLAYAVHPSTSKSRRVVAACVCATCLIAVLSSLSRGAWLGTAAGATAVLALGPWPNPRKAVLSASTVAIAFAAFATFAAISPTNPVLARMSSLPKLLQGLPDATTFDRSVAFGAAADTWTGHAVLGAGPGSLGQNFSTPTAPSQPLFVSNLELRTLTDSGLVGIVGVALIWGGTLITLALRLRRLEPGSRAAAQNLALVAAGLSLLVAFQSSDGTWLAYPWCVLGLALAAATLPDADPEGDISARLAPARPSALWRRRLST